MPEQPQADAGGIHCGGGLVVLPGLVHIDRSPFVRIFNSRQPSCHWSAAIALPQAAIRSAYFPPRKSFTASSNSAENGGGMEQPHRNSEEDRAQADGSAAATLKRCAGHAYCGQQTSSPSKFADSVVALVRGWCGRLFSPALRRVVAVLSGGECLAVILTTGSRSCKEPMHSSETIGSRVVPD